MAGFRIAITSAKGGTGATTVAAALAFAVSKRFPETQFIDCDVEVPDGSLFIKPTIDKSTTVTAETPEVVTDRCTGCGECQAACQYNAIRVVAGKAELHLEACNSCGCCTLVCPADAIVEHSDRIGVVESGSRENINFHKAGLDTGRPVTAWLIRGLKAHVRTDIPTIVDCGSGTASQVIGGIRGSDYCIVVAEPTPFGLDDLRRMVGVVGETGVPMGIVMNKEVSSGSEADSFAREAGIPVLLRIPFDREIASLGSRGVVLPDAADSWDLVFWDLFEQIARGR